MNNMDHSIGGGHEVDAKEFDCVSGTFAATSHGWPRELKPPRWL